MLAKRLFETCLYTSDVETTARFYERLFELERIADFAPRGIALSVGSGVLLLFDPERTRVRDREVPAHGAVGSGHVAFLIEPSELPNWRERLAVQAIEIETEVTWTEGGTSLYFRDPGGNSVELAPPTLWGGGWMRR